MPQSPVILTLNAGSSSIRFALYEADTIPRLIHSGKIERLGTSSHEAALRSLLDQLEQQPHFAQVHAVGHRLVHGMNRPGPQRITPTLLSQLRRMRQYDPDHLPRELAIIDAMQQRRPGTPQVACFDTSFHRSMTPLAKLLPIPHRYQAKGVIRYGFHGLSYEYLIGELGRLDPAVAKGRVILAHLGSGASLAAVYKGKSVDTSMGFTPAAGLVMGTRSGDLDPGLISYMARTERMSPAHFQNLVNRESGLLGVSGTSSDIRDLLAREKTDPRAAQAVDLFCYHARKWIGAFAAVLGGVDALVFAAGIGENSPAVRQRICSELGFLGIAVDSRRNSHNAPLISPASGRVPIRVIPTDEEFIIAKSVCRILNLHSARKGQR